MKPVSPTLSPLVSHGVSETNGSENSSQRANDSSVWRVQEAPDNTWPRRRWWLMLALIFLGQLALIFSLSSRSVLRERPPARAPVLQLANSRSSELMALWDPTLFALPHRQGFSALVWNVRQPSETSAAPQSEPIEYLDFSGRELGAVFNQFVATNRFEPPPMHLESAPDLGLPTLIAPQANSAPSRVRIEGALARRRLFAPIAAPPIPHTEILAPTVVQVVVDADGRTVFAVVSPGSGLREADQRALELTRNVRFESVRPFGPDQPANQAGTLTTGKLIFEWQTVPMPATSNASSGTP
jgi:hypothetical protein